MPTKLKSLACTIIGLAIVMICAGPALAQSAETAFGRWLDVKTGTHIETYKCGAALCAKIVKAIDLKTKAHAPKLKDANNPDRGLRARAVEGLVIMQGAKKDASKPSWTAKIYSPSKGKVYNGTITVKSKDSLELQGCIVWPLCQTAKWTRLPSPPKAAPAPAP